MSPASVRAGNLIRGWMEDAGLRTLAFYFFAVVNSSVVGNLTDAYVDFQMGRPDGQCAWSG